MINKNFEEMEKNYKEYKLITEELNKLNNFKNQKAYIDLSKKYCTIKKKIHHYINYKKISEDIQDLEYLIKKNSTDNDFEKLATTEIKILKKRLLDHEDKINNTAGTKNTQEEKLESIFLEIRSASGGNESAIFAEDLSKMYMNYFSNKKWKYDIINFSKGNIQGYKEIVIKITGENINIILKNESGVHRVQRVPTTDAHGKIQTSTCTVAILPATENISDIEINSNDIRIDTFRASGAGGQHVNMTDSAVRVVHIPTNITVECQNERSQHKNKHNAMSLLKSRLLIIKKNDQKAVLDTERKNMVGTGDRSDKIRTYNYTKNRITDHRKNITLYRLKDVIEGNLDLLINA